MRVTLALLRCMKTAHDYVNESRAHTHTYTQTATAPRILHKLDVCAVRVQ